MITSDPEAKESMPKDETSFPKGFSIYTWNINGIRTLNMTEVIKNLNCDILAVQETKISRMNTFILIHKYTDVNELRCNVGTIDNTIYRIENTSMDMESRFCIFFNTFYDSEHLNH